MNKIRYLAGYSVVARRTCTRWWKRSKIS